MSLKVDIKKKLGSFLLDVSFETEGDVMALLGASGSGKSVTLKCIAGIMRPDEGLIVLNGETLFDSEKGIDLPPQKRMVGYLFQQYALFPNMNVLQNIMCGFREGSKKEKEQKALEYIQRFRLEGYEKNYPGMLSGGQQQRTALARILASGPKAILLDEPFSALDRYLRYTLESELSDILSSFEGEMIWVSHDLGECFRHCSKVCVLEEGISSPVTDMESLVERPITLGAAKLAGHRNILGCEARGGSIYIPSFDMELEMDPVGSSMNIVIPSKAIELEDEGKETFVKAMISDIDHDTLVISPDKEGMSEKLFLDIEKGSSFKAGDLVHFIVRKEKCMLYKK